jgi:hypothetical protein
MTEHTKEPWSLLQHGTVAWNNIGFHIEGGEPDDNGDKRLIAWEQITEADGRRIVAAVNACKRFGTELLEAAAACGGITADPTDELLKTQKERDGLKEELKFSRIRATGLKHQLELVRDESPWVWQGDGSDNIASMSNDMAVLIRADQLRDIIGQRDELSADLSEISAAIGTTRYMDPPDGGGVSLAEQVRRMKAELAVAHQELAAMKGE